MLPQRCDGPMARDTRGYVVTSKLIIELAGIQPNENSSNSLNIFNIPCMASISDLRKKDPRDKRR